ncbi:hypothetical protein LV84_03365 [Algoriphagus ratkowskyi]|uniref:P pilus assembly chaperone PapD n=1 Tax=Algoriphagus ratkowskyi TaxID=57028 RepID=A0A2W7RPQ8_9BACT|nr:hypothetical protein [Algoriphagus ratkowskyi]PZX52755.1 hypothetical protein LV84_03365 [Algoriphagus ratkowskyi]TXD76298.1 hypothetical protein ESW18_17110 [Algoriphagus ratkowskyi]
MKKILLVLLIFIALAKNDLVFGQVSIAPTTIFIDQNGIASVFITNPGDTPQEINVGFMFGYPGNDEQGNLTMMYSDSTRAKLFGIDERIRAFPRTFILAPQQQQTVRLQVRPDRSLAAGTYFTRVKITSNAQTANVEETVQEGVSTRVNFKFDQVIAAFQKVGAVTTGLEFEDVQIDQAEGVLRVVPAFKTIGNSPFIGSVMATLKNAKNETVAEQSQTVALYFSGKRAVELKLPENIASGDYSVILVYETRRSDIPSTDLVQSPPITKIIAVRIN